MVCNETEIDAPQVREDYLRRHRVSIHHQTSQPVTTGQAAAQSNPIPITADQTSNRIYSKNLDLKVKCKGEYYKNKKHRQYFFPNLYNYIILANRMQIEVKNVQQESVTIPSDFESKFFDWRLNDVSNGESIKKRRCSKKNVFVTLNTPLDTLKPGETIVYTSDLKSKMQTYFNIPHFGLYDLQIKIIISQSVPFRQLLSSNWSSNILYLKPTKNEFDTDKTVIFGQVPVPGIFVFRYSNSSLKI